MQKYYSGKKILVAGGTGVIGIQVVKILSSLNSKVSVVSQHSSIHKKILPKQVSFLRQILET